MLEISTEHKLTYAIVCKVANEEETISNFVIECLAICNSSMSHGESYVLVFVTDDFSHDGTAKILSDFSVRFPQVRFFSISGTSTLVDADLFAYTKGIELGAKWVVDINAGFRHQPKDLRQFFTLSRTDLYDCIMGSRFLEESYYKIGSYQRKILSVGGTYISRLFLGNHLTDFTSGFMMFKSEILKKLLSEQLFSRYHFFQTELKFRTFRLTSAIKEVPINYQSSSHALGFEAVWDSLKGLFKLFFIRLLNKSQF